MDMYPFKADCGLMEEEYPTGLASGDGEIAFRLFRAEQTVGYLQRDDYPEMHNWDAGWYSRGRI